MDIEVAWLYPDLMSTYGDRGNVSVLEKRCLWRGIGVEIVPVTLETSVAKLRSCDLIFMGGAQDRQQKLAGEDFLKRKGPVVKDMVEKGIPALFVCAAYQFVGHYYKPYQGDKIAGAGIFDLYTEHPGDQEKRLIGNVVAEVISSKKRLLALRIMEAGRIWERTLRHLPKLLKALGITERMDMKVRSIKMPLEVIFTAHSLRKTPTSPTGSSQKLLR